ncbi:7-deoxyloganetin glucosyltransferase-like [Dioscorea cayenensis subsp. rotundata]|uniref:Glycosyltransferase n=1 Tax=Dioscorea cayennensis subsp. rotundata TaxID=55577 RepID=A0AB40ALA4_DIOCR|nr:7-deoxyloganetin glucosyltransferase-like [Dioscorea cayenensis subsp. rotundata]
MGSLANEKPHAVCMPIPAQGHINAMMQFAKVLHLHGFFITFIHTEFNYKRILKSRGPSSLQGLPDFQFKTIPDGLPPSDENIPQDVKQVCQSTQENCAIPFHNLVVKLNNSSASGVPPVSCIISDIITKFTLPTSQELHIPNIFLCSVSACGFWGFFNYQQLMDKGLIPFKSEDDLVNGYLNKEVDWIPGLKNMRIRDMPSFLRTTDPEDFWFKFLKDETQCAMHATAIIFNTFDDLEGEVLETMSPVLPPMYSVGPLSLILKEMPTNPLESAGSNLWKENPGCIEWLDGKKEGSVVYVNFGSITVMSNKQMVEFAWGLANCGHDFLWVIRSDLVKGENAVLPEEFFNEITESGRGFLAGWCPQEKVLMHPSVGGYLTHCGWNSTMESICAGVPMICWPFFADQQTNCHYACSEWGIGMEIENNAKRDEVEGMIRELMDGDKGEDMKKKALEWKRLATMAAKQDGSSMKNLKTLISQVLLSKQ